MSAPNDTARACALLAQVLRRLGFAEPIVRFAEINRVAGGAAWWESTPRGDALLMLAWRLLAVRYERVFHQRIILAATICAEAGLAALGLTRDELHLAPHAQAIAEGRRWALDSGHPSAPRRALVAVQGAFRQIGSANDYALEAAEMLLRCLEPPAAGKQGADRSAHHVAALAAQVARRAAEARKGDADAAYHRARTTQAELIRTVLPWAGALAERYQEVLTQVAAESAPRDDDAPISEPPETPPSRSERGPGGAS